MKLATILANNLDERLRELANLGHPAYKIAKRARITKEYLSMLRHGKHQPTLGVLERLAKALKTTPDQLVSRRVL